RREALVAQRRARLARAVGLQHAFVELALDVVGLIAKARHGRALRAGDAQHFVERGHALANPAKAVLAKAQHSLAHRVRAQLALGGAVVDHVPRLVVGHEELVDSGAALVAGEVARTAPRRAVDAVRN